MGTGIVAIAATTLPDQPRGLHEFAVIAWLAAATLLVALGLRWLTRPTLRHLNDTSLAHFYGAVPMAVLTVGAGTLLLGRDLIGTTAATTVDAALWSVGTVVGVLTAVAVPYVMFTRHDVHAGDAFGGWLMPVVPPMVSASTGALLVPYVPAGQLRLTLFYGSYAMFGLALVPSLLITALIWGRLAVYKPGQARLVPTLWIVLGPLGQSITAVNLLGAAAPSVVPAQARALQLAGLLYGIPVWGFAILWTAIAAAITVRTARLGLPFSLTWWSFTFPVGTVVTGTSALAAHTGADLFRVLAPLGFVGLLLAWATVAARTAYSVRLRVRPLSLRRFA